MDEDRDTSQRITVNKIEEMRIETCCRYGWQALRDRESENVDSDLLGRLFIFWPRRSQEFEFDIVQAANYATNTHLLHSFHVCFKVPTDSTPTLDRTIQPDLLAWTRRKEEISDCERRRGIKGNNSGGFRCPKRQRG